MSSAFWILAIVWLLWTVEAEWAEEKERGEGLLERVEQLVAWHSCEVAHSMSKQSENKGGSGWEMLKAEHLPVFT